MSLEQINRVFARLGEGLMNKIKYGLPFRYKPFEVLKLRQQKDYKTALFTRKTFHK